MAEIKKPEAYFGTMVRNRNKNEFRANDNFHKHISSVGGESDIQQEHTKRISPREQICDSIEQHLSEDGIDNWLMFMENEQLHKEKAS